MSYYRNLLLFCTKICRTVLDLHKRVPVHYVCRLVCNRFDHKAKGSHGQMSFSDSVKTLSWIAVSDNSEKLQPTTSMKNLEFVLGQL